MSQTTSTSSTLKRYYSDRSRCETGFKCLRERWWGYHAGGAARGLSPTRKSIHLVIGGAVHAGLEVLLEDGQQWLWENPDRVPADMMLSETAGPDGRTVARQIEDLAVANALAELAEMSEHGVEIDLLEQERVGQAVAQLQSGVKAQQSDQFSAAALGLTTAEEPVAVEIQFTDDWSTPVAVAENEMADALAGVSPEIALALSSDITLDQSDGLNKYLMEELAALVEAMTRAYARRRWIPLLEQYEVLEVEREGWWRLAEWDTPVNVRSITPSHSSIGGIISGDEWDLEHSELIFMSRPDALLRDRQTNFLYIQSFKTTGTWDHRKEMDAEIDQQGLSEGVDVERRLREAWEEIHKYYELGSDRERKEEFIDERVNLKTARWLATLPEPPQILGIRYEFLLKGSRKQDKKDPEFPGRYVADTPLVRAYKQDGITADDRRWAWTYDWCEISGKSRRLDYRSWQKSPVWRYMPISDWIDQLDRGDVQPDSYDENGMALDALAEQFVPAILVYRNSDDLRDWLQQIEFRETEIVQHAEELRVVREAGDEIQTRSLMNRYFPQNRRGCVFPGRCMAYDLCHGPVAIRQQPEVSGLYSIRHPNHPQELEGGTD